KPGVAMSASSGRPPHNRGAQSGRASMFFAEAVRGNVFLEGREGSGFRLPRAAGAAPARRARHAGEQLPERGFQPGQHVAAVEGLALRQQPGFVRCGVNADAALLWVYDPNQARAAEEILADLEGHLALRVSWAEDLDCQVGRHVQDGFLWNRTIRQPF